MSDDKVRIFLAHANEDKQAVTELYNRLKTQGYQPWLDKIDLLPGQRWREEIPKAIRNSDIFIACLSQRSVEKRGYVQQEFRIALNECATRPIGTIYLIPLRLDECSIPELRQDEYGINLRDYHWLDYFDADGFERLVKTISYYFPNRSIQPKTVYTPTQAASPTIQRLKPTSTPPKPYLLQNFQEDLGNGATLDMVYIPKGRFMMGSPGYEKNRRSNEGPQHGVKVPSFYMGKHPVTQRQWYAVSLLERVDIELKPSPSRFKEDNLPIEQINWYEAVEFCKRLSKHTGRAYRLSSEAEWEYACRAGTTTSYYFGKSIFVGLFRQKQANIGQKSTTEVGRFPPNAFGLCDMHGNVCEWCLDDWHDNYQGAPTDGSAYVDGGVRKVMRGGSWCNYSWACRSAFRGNFQPGYRFDFIGFRVCCSAPRSLP